MNQQASGVSTSFAIVTSGTTVARAIDFDATMEITGAGNVIFMGAGEAGVTAKLQPGSNVMAWRTQG